MSRWRQEKKEEARETGVQKGDGMRIGKMRLGNKLVPVFTPPREGVGDF